MALHLLADVRAAMSCHHLLSFLWANWKIINNIHSSDRETIRK